MKLCERGLGVYGTPGTNFFAGLRSVLGVRDLGARASENHVHVILGEKEGQRGVISSMYIRVCLLTLGTLVLTGFAVGVYKSFADAVCVSRPSPSISGAHAY